MSYSRTEYCRESSAAMPCRAFLSRLEGQSRPARDLTSTTRPPRSKTWVRRANSGASRISLLVHVQSFSPMRRSGCQRHSYGVVSHDTVFSRFVSFIAGLCLCMILRTAILFCRTFSRLPYQRSACLPRILRRGAKSVLEVTITNIIYRVLRAQAPL